MSKYFRFFPTVQHDLTNVGQKVLLRNILRRFTIESSVKNNIGVYNDYTIQAGDRPDTISAKYYGDSGYAWLILLFNERHDVVFDWPLFNYDFDQYIKAKYGSIPAAQAEVHEYRKILTTRQTKYDGTVIPERYIVVDETTYNSLSEFQRQSISKWDWELEEQEKKRKIKILHKKYLPLVRDEVKNILVDGI